MAKKILLLGPPLSIELREAYGGGVGGYTRKMQLYLEHFKSTRFQQVPCFQTVRGQRYFLGLVGRLGTDVYRFISCLCFHPIAGGHLLGQYRGATPREYVIALICRLLRIPFVYEIKAGVFIQWYENTHVLNRRMIRYVLKHASTVLGQGQPYIDFLQQQLGIEAIYYPNFVSSAELLPFEKRSLSGTPVRILFVGYVFAAKGIFELVEACLELSREIPIQLTIIGEEHPDFAKWADQLPKQTSFFLQRKGRLPHDEVLRLYAAHDIYCYPTQHQGEGHNNTINEAMLSGLVIICTKAGFLDSIIGQERGYLLEQCSVAAIKQAIKLVLSKKEEAIAKTINARNYLEEHFLDQIAFRKLERVYEQMTTK